MLASICFECLHVYSSSGALSHTADWWGNSWIFSFNPEVWKNSIQRERESESRHESHIISSHCFFATNQSPLSMTVEELFSCVRYMCSLGMKPPLGIRHEQVVGGCAARPRLTALSLPLQLEQLGPPSPRAHQPVPVLIKKYTSHTENSVPGRFYNGRDQHIV